MGRRGREEGRRGGREEGREKGGGDTFCKITWGAVGFIINSSILASNASW
jgi:hypothetical protein